MNGLRLRLRHILLTCALLMATTVAVRAQTLLDDIVKRGTINVGVSLGTPPTD